MGTETFSVDAGTSQTMAQMTYCHLH